MKKPNGYIILIASGTTTDENAWTMSCKIVDADVGT